MGNIKRIYVKKKEGYDIEAEGILHDIRTILNIDGIKKVNVINRYDVEGIDDKVFEAAKNTIFSEPAVDMVVSDLKTEITSLNSTNVRILPVEFLPGQYDQRADSAVQCVQLLTIDERPVIKTANIYIFTGDISDGEFESIKSYLVNPLESRIASLDMPDTLNEQLEIPDTVDTVDGFIKMTKQQIKDYVDKKGLAMSYEDLMFVQKHFKNKEERDPTITEIKVLDTYWSDHCRHTTFLTKIDSIFFDEGRITKRISDSYDNYKTIREEVYKTKKKDICLMDMATLAMKYMRKNDLLNDLDVSEEINACSIKVDANINGKKEEWLVMFKNETHNHPTEIEPFGGAATCLGGAIRDPLSGRSYVYQAMRITGCADPLENVKDTMPGKLPQIKITTGAANGYSSYGNQIGLATGLVNEVYHPNFVAKRMEIGAVIGAAPKQNVRRSTPAAGDVIILLGGRTGRDGCGGATGSSKEHDEESLLTCGAEVQKGNPPTERKIQRLFRDKRASCLIKKCNDFGAGGVSVAIGELADGLDIYLDKVPKKYEGLDGTELAISESQERMAVVVSKADAKRFMELATEENLEAVVVANVTDTGRMRMMWNDNTIVDMSREFIDTNGVRQKVNVNINEPTGQNYFKKNTSKDDFKSKFKKIMSSLTYCSKKGLVEMFDSSIGAGTVLMPFGGKHQMTPQEGMVAKLPVLKGDTTTCSVMTYGYDPYIGDWSPYHGATYAVIESLAKIAALGANWRRTRLSFQEYFEKLLDDKDKWGKPTSALLGAFEAQIKLNIPAIGGKDSMSGTFNDINVPPTLVSFAVSVCDVKNVRSSELKKSGSNLVLLKILKDKDYLPDYERVKEVFDLLSEKSVSEGIISASVVKGGGVMEALGRMSLGNKLGVRINSDITEDCLFNPDIGSVLVEIDSDKSISSILGSIEYEVIGKVTLEPEISYKDETVKLDDILSVWQDKLEKVFPTKTEPEKTLIRKFSYNGKSKVKPKINIAKPKVFIPVFPGTNCEYDSKKAFEEAGAKVKTSVFKNLTGKDISQSIDVMVKEIKKSQIIMLPGGFSAGDEPEGAGKFIAAVFRNPYVKEAVYDLLNERDGLMLGICNGFQALIKLGLLPYGEIREMEDTSPTLTFNSIGRHVSCMVNTGISSTMSPWLKKCKVGDVYSVPVSHGEGRFIARTEDILELERKGQIAMQYVDPDGNPTGDIRYNPNGSYGAIEGITSPDGRILGKMGHSERKGDNVCVNVPGNKEQYIFESGVEYFK